MDIEKVLTELETEDLKFPREALELTIANRDIMIPELLAILERTAQDPQFPIVHQKYMGHLYAMYLLAQFREKAAYQPIIQLSSLPGDMSDDVMGETATSELSRILACVSCGDDYLIRRLVENEDANEWVRGSALSALVILVAAGEKSRDEVVDYFQSLFRHKLAREYSFVWNSLVSCSLDLYPAEVFEDIMQCYDDDLADLEFVSMEDVEETMAMGKETALDATKRNPHYTLVTDAIKDMEWWACFKPPKPAGKKRKSGKIGRNDPCSCGSGKKYKKCCGQT